MSKKAAANVVSDPPSYAAYARQRGESPAPPRETGIVAVAESLQHRIEALGNTMKELREALGGVLRDAPPNTVTATRPVGPTSTCGIGQMVASQVDAVNGLIETAQDLLNRLDL